MRDIILFDVDHTLSASWRRDYMLGNASWDEYHAESARDAPAEDTVRLLQTLALSATAVGITGRTEKFRELTVKWCVEHAVPLDELLMRPNDDFRDNATVKRNLLERAYGADWCERIICFFEDSDETVAAFREAGVTVFQVFHRRNVS
jgi:phosphoserine phosphatase